MATMTVTKPILLQMLLLLGVLLSSAPQGAAQSKQPPPSEQSAQQQQTIAPAAPDPLYDSPRSTLFTLLEAAQTLSTPESTTESLSSASQRLVTVFGGGDVPVEFARDGAARLVEILNRLGEVRPRELPDAAEVATKELRRFSYVPYEGSSIGFSRRLAERRVLEAYPDGHIELVRNDNGTWRLSDRTISGLEAFHTAVRKIEAVFQGSVDTTKLSSSLWIERMLPSVLVEHSALGLKYWKWLGLLAILLLAVTVDLIVRTFLRGLWLRTARRRETEVQKHTLTRAVRPFGLLIGALVVVLGLRLLGLPELAMTILLAAARFVMTAAAVMAAWRVTDLFGEFFSRKAAGTSTRIDDLLIPLLRKTAKIFIFAVGIIYLANALNIEILPLLTGLGIGGLAVAFAAKDTIENFFGSVAVIVDRPFDVGDWITIDDVEGTVEEMGLRSTRVRTFYNSLVTVPNASLVRANVDNYGRRKYRRYRTHLSITYDTPPDTIEAFCEGIRELIRRHPYTRKDYYQIWLHEMGATSLDILVYMFHEAPDWTTELRERHRFLLDILRLAKSMNVEFAFPTQTLYMRKEEWSPPVSHEGQVPERDSLVSGQRHAGTVVRGRSWQHSPPPPYEFTGAQSKDEPTADEGEGSQIEDRTAGA